jgi:hypothetical protein
MLQAQLLALVVLVVVVAVVAVTAQVEMAAAVVYYFITKEI